MPCCGCLSRWLCGLVGNGHAESSPGPSGRAADYRPPSLFQSTTNHLALTQSFEEEHTGESPLLPKCSRNLARGSNTTELLNAAALGSGVAQSSSSTPAMSFSHSNLSAGHKARHRRTGSEASKHRLQQPPQLVQATAAALAGQSLGGQAGAKQVPPTLQDVEQLKASAKLGFSTAAAKVEEDDSYYCPTCLEHYTEDNPKTFTACGHHFHLPCLFEWLERKDTCPICESKLQFEGLD